MNRNNHTTPGWLRLGALGLASLIVVACGELPAAETTAPPAPESTTTEAAAPSEPTTTVAAAPSTDAEAATRTVTDFFGVDVEIPVDPQRIVAADDIALGNLLALGVRPVATGVNTLSVPDFLGEQLEGIEDISTEDEPYINRERLLELDPDLIFTVGVDWAADSCELLRAIATTYCYEYGYVTMDEIRTNMTEVGRALGMEEEAQAEVEELDARIADMAQRITEAGLNDKPISVLRVGPDWYSVRFGTVESALMRDLGIARPENQQNYEDFAFDLSLENLADIDGYGLYVYVDTDAEADLAALEANPLWERLDVVKNDRVWLVDSGVWNGISLPAAHAILDDIEATLLAG